jgi:predicted ferric reductase
MSPSDALPNGLEEYDAAVPLSTMVTLLLSVALGAFVAVTVLPTWAPGLSQSLFGEAPKAYWYMSRASAFVAFGLLWASTALGALITNRMARIWPGGPTAFDLHQYTSLLGLAVGLFHALILTGDRYIDYTLAQVLMPFASVNYKPVWVGLGQLAFYALIVVSASFYLRKSLGARLWRLVHILSFVGFVGALAHGVWSGTDSAATWAQGLYWFAGSSVLFLTAYRTLTGLVPERRAPRRRTAAQGRGAPEGKPGPGAVAPAAPVEVPAERPRPNLN